MGSTQFGSIQPWDSRTAAGLGFFVTVILVLTVGRAIAQYYQRQGMLAHFVGVILPTQTERARERMMQAILEGIGRLSASRQEAAWLTMHRAWDGIDPDERSLMV